MNARRLLLVLPLLIALSGCSARNPHPVGGPDGSYALGIVWNHRVYDANETGISTVGPKIGQVTVSVNHLLTTSENGTVSNTAEFPVGTEIYKVPGRDVTQAIAAKNAQGKYLEIEADPNQVTSNTSSSAPSSQFWIEFSSVTQAPQYYSVTETRIRYVGRKISGTNLATNGPASWSSSDEVVAVYKLPGIDIHKAVAARLKDGSYFKADFVGGQKP